MSKKRYPRIQIGQYTYCPLQILGKTNKTIVYEGYHIITDDRVALKIIEQKFLKNSSERKLIVHQIESMHELKGKPNIIQIIDVYETDQCLCIVLQACTQTLDEMLDRHVLKQSFAKLIMQQILLGCQTIHKAGFIHRDLKPSNILIKDVKDIRIADLGYITQANSKQENGLTYTKQNVGSPSYMAPESLLKNSYSYKSDIWALGIIYYQLLTGHLPWKATTEKQLQAQLKTFNIQKYFPPKITEGSKRFLSRTLSSYSSRAGKQDYTQLLEYLLPQYSVKIDLQMTSVTSNNCELNDISPIIVKKNNFLHIQSKIQQKQNQQSTRKNSSAKLSRSPKTHTKFQFKNRNSSPVSNITLQYQKITSIEKVDIGKPSGPSMKSKLSKWLSFNLNH